MKQLIHFVTVCGPVVLGVIALSCALLIALVPSNPGTNVWTIVLSISKFASASIPIQNDLGKVFLLVATAIMCFSWTLFRDYSGVFPGAYDMSVHFDDDGIANVLATYKQRERKQLLLCDNWRSAKQAKLNDLEKLVERKVIPNGTFDFTNHTHSTGRTTFETRAAPSWQSYYIANSTGHLKHSFQPPGQKPIGFGSEFSITDAPARQISLSIGDFLAGGTLIKPEFQQIVQDDMGEYVYDIQVIAATKIQFAPFLGIGDTVYFVRNQTGSLVPIAYAKYR